MKILIKGAGDLSSGVAHRLYNAGFKLMMTDLPQPTVIRRTVSFAQAIFDGETTVSGLRGVKVANVEEGVKAMNAGDIPVLVDPEAACIAEYQPDVVIDAILAKKNINTKISDAPIVIALGPGFYAGKDCHAVVETKRGHYLGVVYYQGAAIPDTGSPGEIGGESLRRLLKAPQAGVFKHVKQLGDIVAAGDIIAYCGDAPLKTEISGCLRGLLQEGLEVPANMKVGDVDPRGFAEYCHTISDKARALGGATLEAMLHLALASGIKPFV